MPFDFTLAIAKLELRSGTDRPDLDGLRARYPELGFVFDLLEDKLHEAEHADIAYRDERRDIERDYQQDFDEIEARNAELLGAILMISGLTDEPEVHRVIRGVL